MKHNNLINVGDLVRIAHTEYVAIVVHVDREAHIRSPNTFSKKTCFYTIFVNGEFEKWMDPYIHLI